jgi:hypothetical protein
MMAYELIAELKKLDPKTIIVCREGDNEEFEPRYVGKWNKNGKPALYLVG